MALGGRWHRPLEVIPVYVPTLIVNEFHHDFALPGEYLLIDGMTVSSISESERAELICTEAPELHIPTIGQRDFK